jgi:hypothetical protein
VHAYTSFQSFTTPRRKTNATNGADGSNDGNAGGGENCGGGGGDVLASDVDGGGAEKGENNDNRGHSVFSRFDASFAKAAAAAAAAAATATAAAGNGDGKSIDKRGIDGVSGDIKPENASLAQLLKERQRAESAGMY